MALGVYCKRVTVPGYTRHIKTSVWGGRLVRVRGHKRKICWRNDGRFARKSGRRRR